jgi:hypothetical protein
VSDVDDLPVDPAFESAPGPGIAAGDAHASLNARAALADATVVIPTNREENYTLRSLPDWVDVEVRRDDGLNVARNAGVEAAEGDWIVLADDDITFPTRLTAALVDAAHAGHLIGLEDFWPFRWILGRFMIFHRRLWMAVGGFDESRSHAGDTDFAVRCEKAGAQVVPLPRKLIPHHDEVADFSLTTHLEWLWYLGRRHPRQIAPKAGLLALRKLGWTPRTVDYPEGFTSQANQPPEREG